MAHCYQLSINEREEISLGLAQKFSKNYIALSLGRSASTICREVNRNTAKGQVYRAVNCSCRSRADRVKDRQWKLCQKGDFPGRYNRREVVIMLENESSCVEIMEYIIGAENESA